MSSDPPLSNSDEVLTSEEEDDAESSKSPHKLFLLGYIPHARHNPTLKTITNDLLSQYYISWNTSKWVNSNGEPSRSRSTIVNADALIFFINEQTLRDTNCLLTLQYAWNLSLPILMLRPPMTKLVISNRDSLRDGEKIEQIGDGAIMRGGEPWQLLSDSSLDVIDFKLLQDILYEGYRLSTLYDSSAHSKSMSRIRRKLVSIFSQPSFLTNGGSSSSSQPHFYLSPSNSSLYDARKRKLIRFSIVQVTVVNTFRPKTSSKRRGGDENAKRLYKCVALKLFD
uniref:Uncharacterized protein n=1 Tax=Caenorhabditis japonica TaxID=281687 RepID=A0A8R1HP56_CAEJA